MYWSHISTVVFSSIAFVAFAIFQVFRSLLAELQAELQAQPPVGSIRTQHKPDLVRSYELVIEVSWNWVMPLAFVFAAFSAGVPTVPD